MQARKKEGKIVQAWQLGAGTEMEKQMIAEGAIIKDDKGYLIKSQEADKGERAASGDWFKVDIKTETINGQETTKYYPYPNSAEYFNENHREAPGENNYEQIPKPVTIYQVGTPMPDEIKDLVDSGTLKINESDPDHYFSAHLWGDDLSLPSNGTVILYGPGDFNLIQQMEFERDYEIIGETPTEYMNREASFADNPVFDEIVKGIDDLHAEAGINDPAEVKVGEEVAGENLAANPINNDEEDFSGR